MSNPRVSVVIPAYNHERFVGPAIESVLDQSFSDLEVVVIDDGSTDRTGEVVQAFEDSRVKYTRQENQDAYNAINHGMRLATGEFIAILNSDDLYAPDRIERLVAEHETSGAQCLFTQVQPIDEKGEPISDPAHHWHKWHEKNRSFYFECGDLYTAFLKGNFMVTTSNLFMTARAVKKVGEFCSLRYLHDYDYIFRMMLAFPDNVRYLHDEMLLHYRIHGSNTLGEAAVTGREQDQHVIRKYMLARVPKDLVLLVDAGSERLVELERELFEVRHALRALPAPNVRDQARALLVSLARKFRKRGA